MLLSTYYDSHQALKDLGVSIPPQLSNVGAALGWPSRAVNALARKHKFQGFSLDGQSDPFEIGRASCRERGQVADVAHCGPSLSAEPVLPGNHESAGEPHRL